MQYYFKAQSQHCHSMLYLAVGLARMRSSLGDAPYSPSDDSRWFNRNDSMPGATVLPKSVGSHVPWFFVQGNTQDEKTLTTVHPMSPF